MQVFERILGIILPVFIIIALGYGYARIRGERVRNDMASVNRVLLGNLAALAFVPLGLWMGLPR